MKTLTSIIIVFCVSLTSFAQNVLTPEKVVELTLAHNFDIKIYRNLSNIDSLENSYSNAGFAPTMNFVANAEMSNTDQNQKLQSGSENNYNNLASSNLNTGVELGWTIFDGGKMFIQKHKLDEYQQLGELELKSQIVWASFEALQVYYSIVMQKELLRSIDTLIAFNSRRLEIVEANFKAGNISKTDVIQAKIDLNLAKSSRLQQLRGITQTKLVLANQIGHFTDLNFDVNDSISQPKSLNINALKQKIISQNLAILSAEKQKSIALLNLDQVKRNYLPTINFNAGYYFKAYSYSEGSILAGNSVGPEVGASFKMPIYNQGETRRNAAIEKINIDNQDIALEKIKLQVITESEAMLNEYNIAAEALELELQNHELATEYLNISKLRLQQGQSTSLEVHQAQVEFIESSARLLNLKMDMKLAELKLLQLAAEI